MERSIELLQQAAMRADLQGRTAVWNTLYNAMEYIQTGKIAESSERGVAYLWSQIPVEAS
jgi:hypothetical protein